jgi:hypothetical protein
VISNHQMAETVSVLMLEISAKLSASVADVQAHCPEGELTDYRRAVAVVMGELLIGIMSPLYVAHPDLKPDDPR